MGIVLGRFGFWPLFLSCFFFFFFLECPFEVLLNCFVVSAEFAQLGRKSRFRDEVVEDDTRVDPNGNV